jgi:1-acyl-sn-glycerol-3-phosphate acyltransferase
MLPAMTSATRVRVDALQLMTRLVSRVQGLRLEGVQHVPKQGAAMIATTHSTPLDFFYVLALMGCVGREDYRAIVAAELLDRQRFRSYTQAALEDEVSWLAPLAGLAARLLSYIVPAVVRRVHPIPVYRNGDDSVSRRESLHCLLQGRILVIAPGRGDSRQRNADGLRPLTFGVASIARRYFETTAEALAVIPLGINAPGRGLGPKVTLRIGEPFFGMCNREYPELFGNRGQIQERAKQEAYQQYTQQLALRLTRLLEGPPR